MTEKPFDPLTAWQDAVRKWEIDVNEWSSRFTETEQFGSIIGQATKMNLVAQKALGDRMEATLQALNLPSKAQLEAIAERLDAIEDTLTRIRVHIEAGSKTTATPAAKPRRTRKPPAKRA